MDPITLFGMAMMAGGALYSGFAGSRAAKVSEQIAAHNRELAVSQARLAEKDADVAAAKGAFEENKLRDHVGRILGGQVATFAARHLDPTSGSPLLAQAFTLSQLETDVSLLRAGVTAAGAQAYSRAASLMGQAGSAAWQEVAARDKQRDSVIAGLFGAGSAFLYAGRAGKGDWFGAGQPAAAGA